MGGGCVHIWTWKRIAFSAHTLWPNYRLGVPQWHTILLPCTFIFSTYMQSNSHTYTYSHSHTGALSLSLFFLFLFLFLSSCHQNPLEGNEWNRLSGQLSWIRAFLSFCPCLSFCPLAPPIPAVAFAFPHQQHIKPVKRNSNWCVPFNEVHTHRDVLHSSFSMKKWGGPVKLKPWKTWWIHPEISFSPMQIYSKHIRQWMHSHGAVHYF